MASWAPRSRAEGADSGDASTDTATQSVDRLLQANVNVIVGAASSAVSQTVIDTITGAGVMQISPANTSDIFTTYDDNGLYFRTAPPDLLQARALADLILEDGNNTVGILALNDPYGTGLAENTRNNLLDGGLSEEDVPEAVIYDPHGGELRRRGAADGRPQPRRDHRHRVRGVLEDHLRAQR